MNWTSGQLNRWTRANKDPVRKRQRKYFARQRTEERSQAHSPLALGHFNEPALQPSGGNRPVTSHYFISEASKPHNPSDDIGSNGASGPYAKENDIQGKGPLEHVRHRLLRNKDWSGLNIAHPRLIIFKSASEMDKIGRRRKIHRKGADQAHTKDGKQDVRARRPDKKKLQMLMQGHDFAPTSDLDRIDCSIRIGSKIHHTQTTDSAAVIPNNAMPSEASSLSAKQVDTQPSNSHHQHVPEQNAEETVDKSYLIPLRVARRMKNFDEVQQRSSSIIRQMSSPSNPFEARPSVLADIKEAKLPNSNSQNSLQPGMTSLSSETSPHFAHSTKAEIISTQGGTQADMLAVREVETSHRREVWSPSAASTGSRPCFTLDHQVLLEKHLERCATENTSPGRGLSSPSPPEEHILINEMITNQSLPRLPSMLPIFRNHSSEDSASDREVTEPHRKRQKITHPTDQSLSRIVSSNRESLFDADTSAPCSQGGSSMRERFLKAKEEHRKHSLTMVVPLSSQVKTSQPRRAGDENETWMKYVFREDFGRMQQAFNFSPYRHSPNQKLAPEEQPRLSSNPAGNSSHQYPSQLSSSEVAPTSVNATIYPVQRQQSQGQSKLSLQSDTDFVSRLSPMEGIIDDRLGPISMYGNAARSDRSFVPLPCQQNHVCDNLTPLPSVNAWQEPQATKVNREPPRSLSQARLWSSSADRSSAEQRTVDGQLVQRPPAMTPLWAHDRPEINLLSSGPKLPHQGHRLGRAYHQASLTNRLLSVRSNLGGQRARRHEEDSTPLLPQRNPVNLWNA